MGNKEENVNKKNKINKADKKVKAKVNKVAKILPITPLNKLNQSLDYVVKETLAQNPDVLKSIAEKKASEYSIYTALADFFPRLDINVSNGSEKTNEHDRKDKLVF